MPHHYRKPHAGMPAGVDLEIGVAHGGRGDSHDRLAPTSEGRGAREKLEAPRSLEDGRDHGHITTVICSTGKLLMISVRSSWTISISSIRTPHS